MAKRKKEARLSKFEVAIKKGDHLPPGERHRPYTFYDELEAFIIFYERLGSPGSTVFYRLGKWKSFKRDVLATAADLGLDPASFYKFLERLEKRYKKSSQPPLPEKKE